MTWERAYTICCVMVTDLRNRGIPAKGVVYYNFGTYVYGWYDMTTLDERNEKEDAIKDTSTAL